jgi:large subunit ribosomal protein L4
MQATIYTTEGKEKTKVDLPESVFGLKWNADLVHQVVVSMESSARETIANTKGRAEVRGGGKKPWKQKGTGRARHGSRRSPIWVGGGVSHGPTTGINYDRKINKKMKTKALFTILSKKMKDGEVLFVDNISFKQAKTKDAKAVLDSMSKIKGYDKLKTKRNNRALILTDGNDIVAKKSFANFGNVLTDEVRNMNPLALLKYKYVIIANPEKSLEVLGGKLTK